MIHSSPDRRKEIIAELEGMGWEQASPEDLSRLFGRCFPESKHLRVSVDSFSEEELYVLPGFFASAPMRGMGREYDLALELLDNSLNDSRVAHMLKHESDWDQVTRDREVAKDAMDVVRNQVPRF